MGQIVLLNSHLAYKREGVGTPHLCTIILNPDNTVRVEVDQDKFYERSIMEDWEVLKPKEISDPDGKQSEDWVGDSMIDDPEDKKPDD